MLAAENGVMESGNQRRSLSIRCNVPASEIADNVYLREFGKKSRVIGLACKTEFWAVTDSLAMSADSPYIFRGDAFFLKQRINAFGIQDREPVGGKRFFLDFIVSG